MFSMKYFRQMEKIILLKNSYATNSIHVDMKFIMNLYVTLPSIYFYNVLFYPINIKNFGIS